MPKRAADEAESIAKKRSEQTLAELFGEIASGMPSCPLLKLRPDQLVRILAATKESQLGASSSFPSKPDSESDSDSYSDSSSESAPAAEFVLDYQSLVNLTLSCKAFSLFMLKREYKDGFAAVALLRCKAEGIDELSLRYLPDLASRVINPALLSNQSDPEAKEKHLVLAGGERLVNHLWSPLIFYLNTVGYPPCRHCGMKTELRGKNGVPISTFLVLRGAGKPPKEPLLKGKDEPHFRKNRAILKAWRRHTYRCVDPACAQELDMMLLNTPLGSVFDACLSTATGQSRHHNFKSQKFQLYKGDGTELDFSVKFCKRCGVLNTEKENLTEQVNCGGQCKSARQRLGVHNVCICARPCSSCSIPIRSCRCTFCESCNRCEGDECERCEKVCQCEAPYCEDCGCEYCECD